MPTFNGMAAWSIAMRSYVDSFATVPILCHELGGSQSENKVPPVRPHMPGVMPERENEETRWANLTGFYLAAEDLEGLQDEIPDNHTIFQNLNHWPRCVSRSF